jgi:hypothetical protein
MLADHKQQSCDNCAKPNLLPFDSSSKKPITRMTARLKRDAISGSAIRRGPRSPGPPPDCSSPNTAVAAMIMRRFRSRSQRCRTECRSSNCRRDLFQGQRLDLPSRKHPQISAWKWRRKSVTLRWRRESRANPSLDLKFPARWENIGNFTDSGSGSRLIVCESIVISGIYRRNSLTELTGNVFGVTGYAIALSG